MASTKQSSRGRSQDRAKVAGGQKHEVSYESKKTGKPGAAIKKAVKAAVPMPLQKLSIVIATTIVG